MPEPDGTPTSAEHLAAETEAERRGLVGSSAASCSRCDFCETNWNDNQLRNVDNYAEDGTLECKLICGDCVAAFASDDIEFNVSGFRTA